jgi:hypothetical protein
MELRRVVTGHTPAGRATVISDGPLARTRDFTSIPGMRASLAWETGPNPVIAVDGSDPTPQTGSFHPEPGSSRLLVIQFPPDSVYAGPDFDPAAADAENREIVPGLAERFESDAPGMHTTESIDYGIVLAGHPVLELDDGHLTELGPGDIVVQNGTRHAWRNPTHEPTTIAFVLIGADR